MPGAALLVLLLLAIAVALEALAERFEVPRPVVLLTGGLMISLLPGLPPVDLDPEVIFFVFVPPLVYWATVNNSLRDFRLNVVMISVTGVLLVLVTIGAVAWLVHSLIPGIPWAVGVAFGAIVAPPDAAVTIAMLRGMKIPRAITVVLFGESVVNEATALVVYRVAIAATVVGHFSWTSGLVDFARIAAGGLAIGLVTGWGVVVVRRWLRDTPALQSTVSLITPFLAYVPASAANVSGALAVAVTGIYVGRQAPRIMSPETRLQARDTWAVVTYILESLTFLLVGVSLPRAAGSLGTYSVAELGVDMAAVVAVLIVVRLAVALPTAYLPAWATRLRGGYAPPPPLSHAAFIGWAGLRGGDSLVIALTLPVTVASGAAFPHRHLLIVLTVGVVIASILGQGLGLRRVALRLGLRSDGVAIAEERIARQRVASAGLAALDEIDASSLDEVDGASASEVQRSLREMHATELVSSSLDTRALTPPPNYAWVRAFHQMRSRMVRAERDEIVRLRDDDTISDEVMNKLLRAIDLEEVLLDAKLRAVADVGQQAIE